MWTYFALGFVAKIVTGFDDALTRIPLRGQLAKNHRDHVMFSLGVFLAVTICLVMASYFSRFIQNIPYYNLILACILTGMAASIYFEAFTTKPRQSAEVQLAATGRKRNLRIKEVFAVGFISSFATFFDDVVVFTPLLTNGWDQTTFVVSGALLATVLQMLVIIYFAKQLQRVPYKKEIASAGLLVFAALAGFGVI